MTLCRQFGCAALCAFAMACGGPQAAALEPIMTVVPCEADDAAGFQVHQRAATFDAWLQARGLDTDASGSVDFQHQVVLIADFGAQPNPAWSIEVPADSARVVDGLAQVPVELREPPAGRRVIQRVTHPCAVYAMQRRNVSRVAFVDGDKTLAQIALR